MLYGGWFRAPTAFVEPRTTPSLQDWPVRRGPATPQLRSLSALARSRLWDHLRSATHDHHSVRNSQNYMIAHDADEIETIEAAATAIANAPPRQTKKRE